MLGVAEALLVAEKTRARGATVEALAGALAEVHRKEPERLAFSEVNAACNSADNSSSPGNGRSNRSASFCSSTGTSNKTDTQSGVSRRISFIRSG